MIFNMIGMGGSGESLIISDTIDINGGIIRTITGKAVKLQTKTITPTSSIQVVNPDDGYDGFSKVTVNAGGGTDFIITLSWDSMSETWAPNKTFSEVETAYNAGKTISFCCDDEESSAGFYIDDTNPLVLIVFVDHPKLSAQWTDYYRWSDGNVWVFDGRYRYLYPNFDSPSRTYTPTESQQTETITFDSDDYNGIQEVDITINAISNTYVGSGITRRSSTDLTASGATVTVPAGYYSSQATKSVSTMTLPTSTASSVTSGYTSKATIGRSTSAQYINIPPGYNSAGAYYVISAVANGSASAPSTISGTSATVSTGTNTLTLTKTVSVTPSVSAGYISSGTATNSSVSLTASVTTKAAATITPSTSNQTIAAGTYLTGAQTIAGDADLVGSNILSTASIFGVQGTVVVQNYYTGSSAPSSSTGSNGDLYLQT